MIIRLKTPFTPANQRRTAELILAHGGEVVSARNGRELEQVLDLLVEGYRPDTIVLNTPVDPFDLAELARVATVVVFPVDRNALH